MTSLLGPAGSVALTTGALLAILAPAASAGGESCHGGGTYNGLTCFLLSTNGEHDLSEWQTVTDHFDSPDSYGSDSFANWTDTDWVSVAELNAWNYSSNTYTNWSVKSHHYAQTWVLWSEACWDEQISDCVENDSPGPLTLPPPGKLVGAIAAPAGRGVRAKESPGIVQRVRGVRSNGTTSVTAHCPAATRTGHAEANLIWPDTPPAGAPDPGLTETVGSATGTIARSALPADGAQLKVLVVCAGNQVRRYGTQSRTFIGSRQDDRLHAGRFGDRLFAGPG